MKHTKLVAWGLSIPMSIALLSGMFGVDIEGTFFLILGSAMVVFGYWACVILFKYKEN